jgi:hypothetical protein
LDFSSLVNLENRIDDLYLPWKFDIAIRQKITDQPLLEHIDRVGLISFDALPVPGLTERVGSGLAGR